MKKIVCIASVILLPFFAFAQWGDPSNNQISSDELQTTRAPRIHWESTAIDAGKTSLQKPISATFELTNTGNAPLIISRVEADCDCTAPEWPRNPIMPGQSATISLEYDAASAGQFQKGAIITANTTPSRHSLIMTGVVERK